MIVVTVAMLALCACTSLPNGSNWGEEVTYRPGWNRIERSAGAAIRDPWVWAPILGAGLLQIDNADRRISDWARESTPVFGSADAAARWSDDLRAASSAAYLGTMLATPSGDSAGTWLENKAKGYLVGMASWTATSVATSTLKTTVGRERPDGSDTESFPSGHVSRSAVFTRLASRNLEFLDLGPGTHLALDISLDALTFGTAWARIEAGAHFPSDVLFSMALGNFFAAFFNDAFLDPDHGGRVAVAVSPTAHGAELQLRIAF